MADPTPSGDVTTARPALPPRRDAGFTMVLFIIVLALLSIAMGVAVQAVSFQMRREREEELIFRGQQYVEGIRLYRMRYGRMPMTLKEMWEANPKVLRKKWKDPITDSTQWGLVFLGQGGTEVRGPGQRTPEAGGAEETPTPTPEPTPEAGSGEGDGSMVGSAQVGPIIGVYSKSCDESVKIYDGRTRYCDWKFALREQAPARGQAPPTRPPQPGG